MTTSSDQMRIFVTGGSGWIGSAVVAELVERGHAVLGLARSAASAERLSAAGAKVHRGSLDDLDSLREGAAQADGVAHLAFQHEIAFAGDFDTAAAADLKAIEVFGDVLSEGGGPLLVASGTGGVAIGQMVAETDRGTPAGGPSERFRSEQVALDLAERGVRSGVVRFATTVHGFDDPNYISMIAAAAVANGVSGYLGDGSNRWPAVHRSDAATLVVDFLERGQAGTVIHAVGEQGVPFREIAEALGRQLDLPSRALSDTEAESLGILRGFVALDIPASNELTRRALGWTPTGPTLIEDIEAGAYTTATFDRQGA
ncbi:SDR family oxidoreductase [Aeromicrobium sp. P5_D10]